MSERNNLRCYWCIAKIGQGKGVWGPIDKDYQPGYHKYWSQIMVRDYKLGDSTYVVTEPFCSFECCLAFIKDNSHDYKYAKSKRLLLEIHHKVTGSMCTPMCATHGSQLTVFGGKLKYPKFRKRFKKNTYDIQRAVALRPAQQEYGQVVKSRKSKRLLLEKSYTINPSAR